MANWQRKILLNPEWSQAKDHEISIQQLALSIAGKLKALPDFGGDNSDINDDRAELVEEFEALAEDTNAGRDDFDYVMQSLYDWGDQRLDGEWNGKKVCWVDCMSNVPVAA